MSKHRKLSEREIRINKFYKFLIDNDAFVEYREAVREGNIHNLTYIFGNKMLYWISCAFIWSIDKRGSDYWTALNNKWKEYCYTEGIS